MAKKAVDVFGFDELEKSFKRCADKYPDQADALLMTTGRAINKRVKALTPVKTKKLRNSWRLKKVKLYNQGKTRVVYEVSSAPHAHLVELGHENVRGGRTRRKGRTLNRVQRAVRGISSHGRTEGKYILEKAFKEYENRFDRDAKKLLEKLTKDLEV